MAPPMPKLYGVSVCTRCSGAFFWRRGAAAAFDMLFFYLALPGSCVAASYLLARSWPFTSPGLVDTLALVAIVVVCLGAFIPPLLYFFKDGCAGYSPGKWLCGLRVMNVRTGRPAGMAESGLRNLTLGVFPPLGLALAGQVRRGPRLGDELAGTRVVWRRYSDSPVFCRQRPTGATIDLQHEDTKSAKAHQGV
jgi:uncharacterized RDD family membrane protein YckC